jgi:pimeloyl-ACP methyl ester carboxylesterase
LFTKKIGNTKSKVRLIWLHGWGQNHTAFLSLAKYFDEFDNVLFDLPGFGWSDAPTSAWGTDMYAEEVAKWLKKQPEKTNYIIGHSFGARVGLRFAKVYNKDVNGLIFIAGAGLKRKRSIFFKTKAFIFKMLGQCLKVFDKIFRTKLKGFYSQYFGSTDYKNSSGIMRNIFIKTISEDLKEIATTIKTPTLLIYGSKDKETPPEIGRRYNKLLTNSEYVELQNFNHYTILTTGRHQVQNTMSKFLNKKI